MADLVLPCCGYGDISAVFMDPDNGVVQCHNCGAAYGLVATFRTALDGLVVAAEVACECYEGFRSDGTLAPLLTGTQIAALRAALATAKEAGG